MSLLLLLSVFVIATCGLVYELIAGTLASYLLGDSVTQFSTIIGAYLSAMGVGSWLSRYIERNLLSTFVKIEILIGVVGGSSAAILFLIFEQVVSFRIPLYSIVAIIGILVGIEIPLLLRILKDKIEFKDLVSKVFTFDYIGALIASILFPLILVPHLGLVRSAFMFGIFNVLIALLMLYRFAEDITNSRLHKLSGIISLICLTFGFVYSDKILQISETNLYSDKIIYATSTPYQRIVLTKAPHDLRLFLNNNLQFSSRDEYRYHEALIHPALASISNPKHVLVLGGGDGMAVREILKYDSIENITLVDLDSAMTKLFTNNDILSNINHNALKSPKLQIVNTDAFLWLKQNSFNQKFDFIVADFPDPSNYSIGKLYSLPFFKLLSAAITDNGKIVVQSTSPFVARKSYWCVNKTIEASGLHTTPYHAYVPSFGEWGFIMAGKSDFVASSNYPQGLKFINYDTVRNMLTFPSDMAKLDTEINRLDNQALVHYFDDEWSEYTVN